MEPPYLRSYLGVYLRFYLRLEDTARSTNQCNRADPDARMALPGRSSEDRDRDDDSGHRNDGAARYREQRRRDAAGERRPSKRQDGSAGAEVDDEPADGAPRGKGGERSGERQRQRDAGGREDRCPWRAIHGVDPREDARNIRCSASANRWRDPATAWPTLFPVIEIAAPGRHQQGARGAREQER